MKKPATRSTVKKKIPDMAGEYRFDYSKARPNRFAARLRNNSIAIVLDPDVASVFASSEAVNTLLRSVMSAIPARTGPAAKSR